MRQQSDDKNINSTSECFLTTPNQNKTGSRTKLFAMMAYSEREVRYIFILLYDEASHILTFLLRLFIGPICFLNNKDYENGKQ